MLFLSFVHGFVVGVLVTLLAGVGCSIWWALRTTRKPAIEPMTDGGPGPVKPMTDGGPGPKPSTDM